MDTLLARVLEKRKVRQSTLDAYRQALDRISQIITGKFYENNTFLKKDFTKIKEFLADKSISVNKKYLSAILIALSPDGVNEVDNSEYQEEYNKYKALLLTQTEKYMKSIEGGKKSKRDNERWTSWKSIEKVQEDLRKEVNGLNESSTRYAKTLTDFVYASLYVLLPPRRLDYANARVVTLKEYKRIKEDEKHQNIYYVVSSKPFFHFGKDSVKSSTEEDEIIQVPTKLKNILTKWIQWRKKNNLSSMFLLGNTTKNNLGKQLSRVFAEHGLPRGISVSMLRKIYVSDHPSNKLKQIVDEEMKQTAKMMNHSTGVQQSIYTKK